MPSHGATIERRGKRPMSERILEEIKHAIQQYETIIIHRHKSPDPDALGSQGGLAELLRQTYPEKKVYQVGESVGGLDFLITMDEISDETYQGALVIVTDTANTARISDDRYLLGDKLIKIDHHPNDEPYGDIVYVNTKASSCSEVIADLWQFFEDEWTMTKKAARLLYAGIIGDTGRFLFPNTSAHTFKIVADLRQFDFDATYLNRQLQEMPLKVARLSGFVYEKLEVDENGAGKVVLTQELLAELGINDLETSQIVSLPGVVDELIAWAIFVQQPSGAFRVRMRSKGPVINTIAKKFHGGGHPLASGANAKDLAEVEAIYQEIKAVCKNFAK